MHISIPNVLQLPVYVKSGQRPCGKPVQLLLINMITVIGFATDESVGHLLANYIIAAY